MRHAGDVWPGGTARLTAVDCASFFNSLFLIPLAPYDESPLGKGKARGPQQSGGGSDRGGGRVGALRMVMDRSSVTVPKPPKREVVRIKVISMGEAGCGKSCLIKRYCEEKFVQKYISTIGVDFGVKSVVVDNHQIKVNFWDLAGADEYFEVRNEFYRDAQGAMLVFDVADRASFEKLDTWLDEAYKHGATRDMHVVVCGNKTDSKNREVKNKEAQGWASKHGFMYYETSAHSGDNVQTTFHALFSTIVRNLPKR